MLCEGVTLGRIGRGWTLETAGLQLRRHGIRSFDSGRDKELRGSLKLELERCGREEEEQIILL